MQNVCKPPYRNVSRLDSVAADGTKKSMQLVANMNSRNDRHNDQWVQRKQEELVCKLDKLGQPFSSVPGKRILDSKTYGRLKTVTKVLTTEERCAATKLRILDEERKKEESEARKAELQKYSKYRTKGPKLSQVNRNRILLKVFM